eukprot:6490892-Amphidinium_carterae.2
MHFRPVAQSPVLHRRTGSRASYREQDVRSNGRGEYTTSDIRTSCDDHALLRELTTSSYDWRRVQQNLNNSNHNRTCD